MDIIAYNEKTKTRSIHFDSIIDFMEHKFTGPNKTKAERYIKKDSYLRSGKYGPSNTTVNDVFEHALLGDSEMLKDLESKCVQLDKVTNKNTTAYTQKIQTVKRKRVFADQGDELDIEKVYQGNLDTCWSRTERIVQDATHQLVTIFINIASSWKNPAEISFWRAAVALRLVEELQNAGKSVKIIIGGGSRNLCRNDKYEITTASFTVKEYNENITMERLAGMCHLGFFRVFGFAALCAAELKVTEHLGTPIYTSVSENIPLQLKEDIDRGHTRMICVGLCDDVNGAKTELERCYRQLEKYSKEG